MFNDDKYTIPLNEINRNLNDIRNLLNKLLNLLEKLDKENK